ncbi:hypothetical protein LIER_37949 [Lithospermum erythrorhizon]|uniref:Uncharacterized protein n=1 Tax=Lithospermum erythrorhizon TaxID=34254 RepID=A0AAV3PUI3_LITER
MSNKEEHSTYDSDDDDTLSFSNLPILGNDDQEINKNPIFKNISSSPHEDPFEFFNNLLFQESTPATPRVIICKQKEAEQEPIDKLSASSSSSSSSNSSRKNSNYYYKKNTSSSRFSSISNVEKVNITSITSMSSKSRKIMFMFGPAKFNQEMELSSIKMRQSKRKLKQNLVSQADAEAAAAAAEDSTIVSPATSTNINTCDKKREWRLMRSFSRYRSSTSSDSSATSCGCFS